MTSERIPPETRPPSAAAKPAGAKSGRDARLKAALKANMGRRKAQARARAEECDPGDDQLQTGGATPAEKE